MANPVAYNFKAIKDYCELKTFKKVAEKYGLSQQMVMTYYNNQLRTLQYHGFLKDWRIPTKKDSEFLLNAIEQYEAKKKREEELVEKANAIPKYLNIYPGIIIETKLYLSVIELNKLIQTL